MTAYTVIRELRDGAVAFEVVGTAEAHDVKSAIMAVHHAEHGDEPVKVTYRAIPSRYFDAAFKITTVRRVKVTLEPTRGRLPRARQPKPDAVLPTIDLEQLVEPVPEQAD